MLTTTISSEDVKEKLLLSVDNVLLNNGLNIKYKEELIKEIVKNTAAKLYSIWDTQESLYNYILNYYINHYLLPVVKKFEREKLINIPIEEDDTIITNYRIRETINDEFKQDHPIHIICRVAKINLTTIAEKYLYKSYDQVYREIKQSNEEVEKYESDVANAWQSKHIFG